MKLAVSSLHVVSAYVIEDLVIPVFEAGEEARHLILTGPNGSGKSSVLRGLLDALVQWPNTPVKQRRGRQYELEQWTDDRLEQLDSVARAHKARELDGYRKHNLRLDSRPLVEPSVSGDVDPSALVLVHLPADRRFQPKSVSGPKRLDWPQAQTPTANFASLFLQYLVNRRSEQAFAREDGDEATANKLKEWFEQLRAWLAQLFDRPDVELRFNAKSFTFDLILDSHAIDFNTLPDGFSSALALWTEILLRVESVGGETQGFVLIDEPELHLHPELQEQLLPFLTQQFPSLQFIVATHSPMVMTSLANATIFDLEDHQAKRGAELQGYRYGNILKSHFGLRTDFDSATTAKLDRLYALHRADSLTRAEDSERASLARELAEHHHLLALEVLKGLDDD